VSVALVIQYAKRMCRIIFHLRSVWVYHISTLSHKRTIFRKVFMESKMCDFSFFAYVSNIHSKKNSATYHRRVIIVPITIVTF